MCLKRHIVRFIGNHAGRGGKEGREMEEDSTTPFRTKEAPPSWTPEYVGASKSRAKRFLAWCAVIETGDVNPTFHPEDDFADVMQRRDADGPGVPVWDVPSAARLNACMEAAFQVLSGDDPNNAAVWEALHAIYFACGYEDESGEATE